MEAVGGLGYERLAGERLAFFKKIPGDFLLIVKLFISAGLDRSFLKVIDPRRRVY